DDPDVLVGQPGHQGEDGANGVRRLARHVDGGFARRAVDVGDAAARLERSGMAARIERVQPDDPVGLRESGLRGGLVAGLPVVDVVVLLVLLVVANHDRVGLLGGLRRMTMWSIAGNSMSSR